MGHSSAGAVAVLLPFFRPSLACSYGCDDPCPLVKSCEALDQRFHNLSVQLCLLRGKRCLCQGRPRTFSAAQASLGPGSHGTGAACSSFLTQTETAKWDSIHTHYFLTLDASIPSLTMVSTSLRLCRNSLACKSSNLMHVLSMFILDDVKETDGSVIVAKYAPRLGASKVCVVSAKQ